MIRAATQADFEKIADLFDSWHKAKVSISSKFASFERSGFLSFISKMIEARFCDVFVYVQDDQFLGCYCLMWTPNVYNPSEIMADIYFIDVIPEARRLGIASRMIEDAEIRAKGKDAIALTVSFKSIETAEKVKNKLGYTFFEYKLIKKLGD